MGEFCFVKAARAHASAADAGKNEFGLGDSGIDVAVGGFISGVKGAWNGADDHAFGVVRFKGIGERFYAVKELCLEETDGRHQGGKAVAVEKHGSCAFDGMEQLAVVLLAVFVFDRKTDAVGDEEERAVGLFDLRKIITVFAAGLFELSQEFSAYADSAEIAQYDKRKNGRDNGREENE